MIKAACFYIAWQLLYEFILYPDGRIDQFLAVSVASLTQYTLAFFGWDISVLNRLITIEGYRGVEVLNECNALKLMSLYSGFIIAVKGPPIKRIIYIVTGLVIIYALNIFRIMAFSLATVYFQQYWDTFHEFSPFIFFYPVILTLWYKWTLLSEKNTRSLLGYSIA